MCCGQSITHRKIAKFSTGKCLADNTSKYHTNFLRTDKKFAIRIGCFETEKWATLTTRNSSEWTETNSRTKRSFVEKKSRVEFLIGLNKRTKTRRVDLIKILNCKFGKF